MCRHNCVAIQSTMETIMINKKKAQSSHSVIDLGRASRETKGNTPIHALDDVSGAFKSQPGLSAD